MSLDDLPRAIRDHYRVHEWRHASAVLAQDFREEWKDIIDVLSGFRIRRSHISVGGGGKSKVSGSIEAA
jgi:Restriction endonuclease BglII